MAPSNPVVVMHTDSRRRVVFSRVVVVLLFVLTLVSVFQYGAYKADTGKEQLAVENSALRSELKTLSFALQETELRAVKAERAQKIDQEAKKEVEKWAKNLQAEIYNLKEEVNYYRSALEPTAKSAMGLQLNDFEILEHVADNRWRYRLVLANPSAKERLSRGNVKIAVTGRSEGQEVTLGLSSMHPTGKKQLPFNFRFYQQLTGELVLPEGMVPTAVRVVLEPKDGVSKRMEKDYVWQFKQRSEQREEFDQDLG